MNSDFIDASERFTDGIRPHWAGRVKQNLIRRLYQNDAQGIVDVELIDEVGMGLLLRCQSILTVTAAHEGRATCPRCNGIIQHQWDKEAVMTCPQCGWQTTWGAYFNTYRDKQLHGGGAVAVFQNFVAVYPLAQTPREKLLLIDRLLHAFHWELRRQITSRPAACNLIGGKLNDVIDLLDSLTYGEGSTPGVQHEYELWIEKAERTDWMHKTLLASRERRMQREGD